MKLLYITPLIPYPAYKGHQITALSRIKELSKKHDITLLCFYSNEKELKDSVQYLKKYCSEVIPIRFSILEGIWNIIKGVILSELPLQVLFYTSAAFQNQLKSLLINNTFTIVHLNCLRLANYVEITKPNTPLIIDLIDSYTLNISRRISKEVFPLNVIFYFELNRVRKYEQKIAFTFANILVAGEEDKKAISHNNKIKVIPLGVESSFFTRTKPLQFNKKILFSGNMGYKPNIDAIEWFIENCWLQIQKEVPNSMLIVAGANPTKSLLKFNNVNNIKILGKVDSMVEVMNEVQIAIAPMQIGSGMQNKILEAMSCELPVISTKLGIGSIKLGELEHEVIANAPSEFSTKCIHLLNNLTLCNELGAIGKNIIINKYSIESHCFDLEAFYKQAI